MISKFKYILKLYLLALIALLLSSDAFSQLSSGGTPLLFANPGLFRNESIVRLEHPDAQMLELEDYKNESSGFPERMGVTIPVNLNPSTSGQVSSLVDGSKIWTTVISVEGAVGLGLYFSDFKLPAGARLFIFSQDKKQVIGAFTEKNNKPDGLFSTEIIKGENITLEYFEPNGSFSSSPFTISEVLYVYKPMYFAGERNLKGSNSGSCEVNMACSEGDNWRKQGKSVVRIQIKNGNAAYWCTGTIVNNTAGDFSPLVLTADHCARSFSETYATPSDVAQWIFYFLYETQSCDDETVEASKSLTGAVKLASSSPNGNDGSDFYLVTLNEPIPASYEPFYAGWSRTGEMSPAGVGIHHPAGDVKKISTYTAPLTSSEWGDVAGTHFRVVWSATENGHGVTEGGSSGSPVFDNMGRLIGQLTGGESGCSNLTGPDYYGKLAFSWESNGIADSVRLKPWLDPLNTGLTSINGSFNSNMALARFKADTAIILVGTTLDFFDQSTGNPSLWNWYFEGGEPRTSNMQHPKGVAYNQTGLFDVKLKVTNAFGADSLLRENYIKVVPRIYPNPTQGEFFVMMGDESDESTRISIADTQGRIVYESPAGVPAQPFYRLNMSALKAGFYLVTIQNRFFTESARLLLVH